MLHFAECSAHLGNLQLKALKPNALPRRGASADRARANDLQLRIKAIPELVQLDVS